MKQKHKLFVKLHYDYISVASVAAVSEVKISNALEFRHNKYRAMMCQPATFCVAQIK